MTVIKANNLTKEYKLYGSQHSRFKALFSKKIAYKPKVAVKDCTFSIEKGERVALLGVNGSGKTTLLKMIMGIVFPTSGEIEVDGVVTPVLGNNTGLDHNFTARENIRFRAGLLGLDKEKTEEYMAKVIEFAELGEYIDQPLRTYSAAMKNKLGYTMGIMAEQDILLMDEMLSAGDGDFKKKCIERLKGLLEDDNLTFIYATHLTKVAKRYCTRGIVMKKGEILFDGPIEEAIELYKSTTTKKDLEQAQNADNEADDLLMDEEDFEEDF